MTLIGAAEDEADMNVRPGCQHIPEFLQATGVVGAGRLPDQKSLFFILEIPGNETGGSPLFHFPRT